jgi:hypothetical protein
MRTDCLDLVGVLTVDLFYRPPSVEPVHRLVRLPVLGHGGGPVQQVCKAIQKDITVVSGGWHRAQRSTYSVPSKLRDLFSDPRTSWWSGVLSLVVRNMSERGTPEALMPSPTSFSFPGQCDIICPWIGWLIRVLTIGGSRIDVSIAILERGLDGELDSRWFRLPSPWGQHQPVHLPGVNMG